MPSSARKNHSPAWKNPREVFKTNLYKRRSNRQVFGNKLEQNIVENLPLLNSPVKKEKLLNLNPFKKPSPNKQKSSRLKVINWDEKENESNQFSMEYDVDWDDTIAQQPFDTSFKSTSDTNSSFIEQNLTSIYPIDFSHLSGFLSSTPKNVISLEKTAVEKQSSAKIPVDLRLGTKLRLISKKPFPWVKNSKTPGQSHVIIPALERDIAIKHLSSRDLDLDADLPSSFMSLSKLQLALCYFQFPNVSFMQMFPRCDSQTKPLVPNNLKTLNMKTIDPTDSTYKDWTHSFEQLYHSWKRCERRSFYVCAPKFTMLFFKSALSLLDNGSNLDETCWSVNGSPRLHVVITPTSKGLRQLFRDEGIEFELPLSQSSRRNSREQSDLKPSTSGNYDNTLSLLENSSTCTIDVTQSQPPLIGEESLKHCFDSKKNEDESPIKNDLSGEEEETWLKDMGVSPATIRLKRHHTISEFSRQSSSRSNSFNDSGLTAVDDKKSKSTALIKDAASIQGFYNLLYNGKIGRTMIGPHAGLPPTLIATSPFINGALRELSKTSQVIKKNGKEMQFVLELDNGPILSFMPRMVMEFIKSVPTLNNSENKIIVQVNDRFPYTGFNEAIDSTSFTNNNEFEFDVEKNLFLF